MKDKILLVEDDPQQSATIKTAVEQRYRNVDVELVETESEFCDRLKTISTRETRPRMVICDVMLPWAFPAPDAPPPPEDVEKETFRKAGLRCWKRFRQHKEFRDIPWIHFTVLDEKTIDLKSHSDEKTGYTQKAGTIAGLLAEIEEFKDHNWQETDDQVSKRLAASPKMRKTLLEGLNTSLNDCATSLP